MSQRRRQRPESDTASETKASLLPPGGGNWKGKIIAFLFALILLAAIWSAGVFKKIFPGPNIPLPRQVSDFSLGMTLDEIAQKYPMLKKNLRPFNDDPQFKIVTLNASAGVTGTSSVDLLFYVPNGKLYFMSAMWDDAEAKNIPVGKWADEYRRWGKSANGNPENLGKDVSLKEWKFSDNQTEMTLRDLDYSGHIQRWQELRDASNDPAQQAFAKYRLDSGS